MDSRAVCLHERDPLERRVASRFYAASDRLVPWFVAATLLLTLAALAVGLLHAQPDRRGAVPPIVFLHVPAAWMSQLLYLVMAACAALALALKTRLPATLMASLAPTGAMFTILALWTGSLWGMAAWDAPWMWDARLTCELILFGLYVTVMSLRALMADPLRADRACAVLVLVGMLNIPTVYFSLDWWNTLHRGVAADVAASAAVVSTKFWGMLLMALAFGTYALAVVLARARCLMLGCDSDRACLDGKDDA